MDVRQQITLASEEVKKIVVDHLKRLGFRVSEGSINIERDGNFRALSMSEDEIYLTDTEVLLQKPISQLELTNKKLKEKIIKISPKDAVLGNIICNKISRQRSKDSFLTNNSLEDFLFSNFASPTSKEDLLDSNDEDELIEVFGSLGIKLNKRQ
jgi:hypothetical protein